MNTQLLDQIEQLAGPQRALTFRKAAEFILEHNCRTLVETGCYRGIKEDGQSTIILALLAKEVGGSFDTFDISPDSIDRARSLTRQYGILEDRIFFHEQDSVVGLSGLHPGSIGFAYLDSYDHDAANPGPCQRHQLAEVGAIYGMMRKPCAILLDDHVAETGGKTAFSAAFLKDRGWTLAADGYQLLYVLT